MKKLIKWIEESENRHWYTPFYGAPYGCKYINYSFEGVIPKSQLDDVIQAFKNRLTHKIHKLTEDEFDGEWNLTIKIIETPVNFYFYLGGPGSGPPPPPPPGDDD